MSVFLINVLLDVAYIMILNKWDFTHVFLHVVFFFSTLRL